MLGHPKRDIPLVAGVLIGGKGSRLGISKPLVRHPCGLTFLEYSVRIAREVTQSVVLLGRAEGLPTSLIGMPILEDALEDSGPLAGLCSLLEYGAPGWVCLLACDLPHLTSPMLERLLVKAGDEVDAVAFSRNPGEQVYHTCCTLYHSRVRVKAETELGSGKRLQSLLRQVRLVAVRPSESERRQLTNVNTVADLRALRRLSPAGPGNA